MSLAAIAGFYVAGLAPAAAIAAPAVPAPTTVILNFDAKTTGQTPMGPPIDGPGGLYGTTSRGGKFGGGTVYRVRPDGTVKVLHDFAGSDGYAPWGGLVKDTHDVFYGVTRQGGVNNQGTVYRISPQGDFKLLHSFKCCQDPNDDGVSPRGELAIDRSGNFYGTTEFGGVNGAGTVFKILRNGTETILKDFANDEGLFPNPGLAVDADGNLYGTTKAGGASNAGVVFRLTPGGTETVLHSFSTDDRLGEFPDGSVILDAQRNLYGMTPNGGMYGAGTIYKLTASGAYSVVFSFYDTAGALPSSRLLTDANGNFYGTAALGGKECDCGTAFSLPKDGKFSVLHRFSGRPDGSYLTSGLNFDRDGNLIGVAERGGGSHGGTLFRITIK